ncbi:hypothetical protein [Gordoniibacillus kamchatkensis]|nr:hypothetical protein [Paenibacillus sp. VKM B-2647]
MESKKVRKWSSALLWSIIFNISLGLSILWLLDIVRKIISFLG